MGKDINKLHLAAVSAVGGIIIIVGLAMWMDGAAKNVDHSCCGMSKAECDQSAQTCFCSCTPGGSFNDESLSCESDSVKQFTTGCSEVPNCEKCLNRQTDDFSNHVQKKCAQKQWDCLQCAPGYKLDKSFSPSTECAWPDEDLPWFKGIGQCVSTRKLSTEAQLPKFTFQRRPDLVAKDWTGFERMLQVTGSGRGGDCSYCDSYERLCDDRGGQIVGGFISVAVGIIALAVGLCLVCNCCDNGSSAVITPVQMQPQYVAAAQPGQVQYAQAQPMQVQQQMQVTVPPGMGPGSMMSVAAPTGAVLQIQVPVGAAPGATFTIAYQPQQQQQQMMQPAPVMAHAVPVMAQ